MMSIKLKVRCRARRECAARMMTGAAHPRLAGVTTQSSLELAPRGLSLNL
jgi:hypothetical protein